MSAEGSRKRRAIAVLVAVVAMVGVAVGATLVWVVSDIADKLPIGHRQTSATLYLREGSNRMEIRLPRGRYVFIVKEQGQDDTPTGSYRIRGLIGTEETSLDIDEVYSPDRGEWYVAESIFVENSWTDVLLDMQLNVMEEGRPIYMCIGPMK